MLGKFVDEGGEPGLIFEQCRDVVKENPLLGKIGNLADELLQMIGVEGRDFRHLPRSFENEISELQQNFVYQAPSIRKEFRSCAGVASETSTVSTRAALGPSRKRPCNPLSWSRVPWASTSTLPS